MSEKTTTEKITAYRKDFIDNHVTNVETIRTPMKKPIDNLKPEGNIDFTPKQPYKPAEKVVATKPQDNLFVSGEFEGKFGKYLNICSAHLANFLNVAVCVVFVDITTNKTEFTGKEITKERASPVRRNTWTKLEGDLTTTTTSQTEYIDHTDVFEKASVITRKTDNLLIEGTTDYTTTNQVDFIDQEFVYQRPRKRTWTKDDYEKFHHQTDEQTFIRKTDTTSVYDVKDIRESVRIPQDNLKPEGEFERPEGPKFYPAERPQQIKPTDNLRPEGDFDRPTKAPFKPGNLKKLN